MAGAPTVPTAGASTKETVAAGAAEAVWGEGGAGIGRLDVGGLARVTERRLWQLFESPGRQHEQSLFDLTQIHRTHFARPLHRQHRCEDAMGVEEDADK